MALLTDGHLEEQPLQDKNISFVKMKRSRGDISVRENKARSQNQVLIEYYKRPVIFEVNRSFYVDHRGDSGIPTFRAIRAVGQQLSFPVI